jgi:hypothetical protein
VFDLDKIEADVLLVAEKIESIKKEISKSKTTNISKKELLESISAVSKLWLKDINRSLGKYGIESEIIEKYSATFTNLFRLSYKPNRSKSFLNNIDLILDNFINEIVIPIQISATDEEHSELYEILEEIKDQEENEYMKEAIDCAEEKHFRAAVILGWCATIDRIHKAIEKNGFDKFSNMTQYMKAQTTGRFKRFNKSYMVTNMSEMQEVFDNDVLLTLEALGFIDNNENTRLSSCYNMRCNCGHPGNAPMTKYNVMSFFSDIIEIVFKNPKFTI